MLKWHCDHCGKRTFMMPKVEPLHVEKEMEVEVVEFEEHEVSDPSDPEKKVKAKIPRKVKRIVKNKIPKTAIMKRQHAETGEIEEIEIHEHKDLQPRNYIVSLRTGGERIQRNFCRGCLQHLNPELQALWSKLEVVKPAES